MREILFRGKRDKRFGAELWVYGVPFIDTNDDCIMKNNVSERVVVPETVGQFTGLTDKNDNKIFEGDIVRCKNYHGTVEGYIGYSKSAVWFLYCISGYSDEYLFNCADIEVIGNIHDNPEMLEEENQNEMCIMR